MGLDLAVARPVLATLDSEMHWEWEMAIEQHIEILRRGLREWNAWRRSEHNFNIRPDLSGVDLQGADLAEGYFREVNLSSANLRGANLARANLSGALLRSAILTGADLCRASDIGIFYGAGETALCSRPGLAHHTKMPQARVPAEIYTGSLSMDPLAFRS